MPPKKTEKKATKKVAKQKKMAEHLCDLIDEGKIELPEMKKEKKEKDKFQARFLTPFSKGKGVCISKAKGQRNLLTHAGKQASYKSIANSITGKYKKKHLKIISEYLDLDCDNSVIDLDTFNKHIKKKIQADPEWKDACKNLPERTRKALDHFSAMLMVSESYGFGGDGTKSRQAIQQMIDDYPDSTDSGKSTPSNHLRGNGKGPCEIFNQGSRGDFNKENREETYTASIPLSKHADDDDYDSSLSSEDESSPHLSDGDNIYIEIEKPKKRKALKEEREPMMITKNYGSPMHSSPTPSTSTDTTINKMSEEHSPSEEDSTISMEEEPHSSPRQKLKKKGDNEKKPKKIKTTKKKKTQKK